MRSLRPLIYDYRILNASFAEAKTNLETKSNKFIIRQGISPYCYYDYRMLNASNVDTKTNLETNSNKFNLFQESFH